MKQRIWGILTVLGICGMTTAATAVTKEESSKPEPLKLSPRESVQAETLTNYLSALASPNRKDRIKFLLLTLQSDPYSGAAVTILRSNLQNDREENRKVCRELLKLAEKYPRAWKLAAVAAELAKRNGVDQTEYSPILKKILRETESPAQGPGNLWLPLLAIWLDARAEAEEWEKGSALLDELSKRDLPPERKFPLLRAKLNFYQTADRRTDGSQYQKRYQETIGKLQEFSPETHAEMQQYFQLLLDCRLFVNAMELSQKLLRQEASALNYSNAILASFHANRRDEAEKMLAKLMETDRKNGKNAGLLYTKLMIETRQFEKAGKLLKTLPANPLRANLEREFLIKSGRWEELRNQLNRQLEVAKEPLPRAELYNLLLLTYEKSPNRRELSALLAKLEKDPVFQIPELANSAAYTMALVDLDLEKAERFILRALADSPENMAYLDTAAWIYFRQGKLPQAREYILKAVKNGVDGSLGIVLEHAGDIFRASGDDVAARKFYRRALKNHTDEDFDETRVQRKLDK